MFAVVHVAVLNLAPHSVTMSFAFFPRLHATVAKVSRELCPPTKSSSALLKLGDLCFRPTDLRHHHFVAAVDDHELALSRDAAALALGVERAVHPDLASWIRISGWPIVLAHDAVLAPSVADWHVRTLFAPSFCMSVMVVASQLDVAEIR